ncbi:hypothetical protein PC116_g5740 [Phytophthora cactorum]|uniref:Uncharacterized protein n=1 Tax=Phytophthora cactorum TaxID=29920 RepID=A0A8T1B1C7_9STRA|nr:hypothetical protein PC117_g24164 [Phytophthora cactorum]KAG2900469.1 hypothetical protein PC114_g13531 [Phytophthora cactorum]KAG2969975.1 hypothetical protein PC119_g23763 [Phytophthora cactorum]KAG2987531.1 hypothetical protein PC120_g23592 [Phytophthora cactorum]KAG3196326.1 hypothetical protein PC128_g7727 [Phytophthora cactorum]
MTTTCGDWNYVLIRRQTCRHSRCSNIINGQGITDDPERINSLRALPYPMTAGELEQFVCAINWMRESIIDFTREAEPLQRRLDAALASTKRI